MSTELERLRREQKQRGKNRREACLNFWSKITRRLLGVSGASVEAKPILQEFRPFTGYEEKS